MSFLKQDVPELEITGLGKGLHDLETLTKPPPRPKKAPSAEDQKPYVDGKSTAPEGACQCRTPGAGNEAGAGATAPLELVGLLLLALRRKSSR